MRRPAAVLDVGAVPAVMLQDYAVETLEVGYDNGSDRLLLWLPMTVTHVINESSPLRNWKDPQSILMDQDATIVAIVSQLFMAAAGHPNTCPCIG